MSRLRKFVSQNDWPIIALLSSTEASLPACAVLFDLILFWLGVLVKFYFSVHSLLIFQIFPNL
jgi:hypothetical protein